MFPCGCFGILRSLRGKALRAGCYGITRTSVLWSSHIHEAMLIFNMQQFINSDFRHNIHSHSVNKNSSQSNHSWIVLHVAIQCTDLLTACSYSSNCFSVTNCWNAGTDIIYRKWYAKWNLCVTTEMLRQMQMQMQVRQLYEHTNKKSKTAGKQGQETGTDQPIAKTLWVWQESGNQTVQKSW